MKNDIGDACEFDDVTVSLLAETSIDGDEWGRWTPSTAIDREEPRTGGELRKVLRTYGRTVASAIAATPHEARWVRVVARCTDTNKTLGMDVRAFDWITRGYLESPARSWVICDNGRECDQWRVQRLTARMGSWGARGNARKHAKARPTWYAKRVTTAGAAALAVLAVGASVLTSEETDRPPSFAAPGKFTAPTRTEVVKVVDVRIPDGDTVAVPVRDEGPVKARKEEIPARAVDETLSRVGVEAVMDVVKSEE
ncbi:hypothetical protein [Streptomyces sp. NPDC048142]|uniref:hypothetical protein n=1 Tax=Streptomyces sp. NPDC048142 TaxID=3365501 RepID=UPI0037207818